MAPLPITPDTESGHSDLSDDLDLLPQLQHLLDEERALLPQYHTPLPSAPENHIPSRAKDMQREEQQWHLLRTLPAALATTKDLLEGPRASPTLVHTSQRAPAVEERDDIPSLNVPPSPAVAAAICLMVEDPYFDTPMSSPSSVDAPMEAPEETKEWAVSSVFNTPSLCLNDQTLELSSPASGKWSYKQGGRVEFLGICINRYAFCRYC